MPETQALWLALGPGRIIAEKAWVTNAGARDRQWIADSLQATTGISKR